MARLWDSFTLDVPCMECGETTFPFYIEPPDPSVGLSGIGISPEFNDTVCSKCGEKAPDEKAAERRLRELEDDF
jgi:hypothetical protein